MAADLTPPQARVQDSLFVSQCSLDGLKERLPLRWPVSPDLPPSPKRLYRSCYRYLGYDDLLQPANWQHRSDFDLILRLVDFSGLRPLLAYLMGWTSARGWCPFDPVSMFLLHGWQITNTWTRAQTLQNLQDPRYADYAQRFGFGNAIFPSEGGMRHFLNCLGRPCSTQDQIIRLSPETGSVVEVAVQRLNHLIVASVNLFRQANLLAPTVWSHALVCPEGQDTLAYPRLR